MKDAFYFSHDYNARSDQKIKRLIARHGMEGYGIFWSIIEDLYNNANALRTDYDCIAYDLRTNSETIKSIINDFDLFEIDNDIFSSNSISQRLNERLEKSEKARSSALYRWEKNNNDANAMRTQCDSNAIKERKGNKRKGNIIDTSNEVLLSESDNETDLKEKSETIPYKKIVEFWNQNTKLSKVKLISESRKRAIKARWRESGKDAIMSVMKKTFDSDFLNGRNDKNWTTSFDWIFNPSNFAKILEGNYDNRKINGIKKITMEVFKDA